MKDMNKKDIEKKLNKIIFNNTPDVLDNVLTRCEDKKGLKIMDKKQKVKKTKMINFIPRYATVFAAFVICIGGLFGFNYYLNNQVDSIIDFDVNPSIEISTNRKEKIIKVIALNDDGKEILDDMNLKNVDLEVGINAIIGSMLKNGYITEVQNSILVSVKNDNTKKAEKLQREISEDINEILKGQNIKGAVLTQSYNNDDEDDKLETLAKKYNISEGKARLINKVLKAEVKDSKGNLYDFENLAKLSINELKLLLESKDVKLENVKSNGATSEKAYIGKEKAKQIALNAAKLKEKDVKNLKTEFDSDKGVFIYEVEFDFGNKEYEYDINAKTGKIVKTDIEIDDDKNDIYDDIDDDDDDDD